MKSYFKNATAGCFLIALAYLISGKAALFLALPPGYAAAIFPPAGIAVAATLIMGVRALPWVFLGSLLLNIWVGYSASPAQGTAGVIAALLIALASTLQAGAGGWALRRAVGYPVTFDKAAEIFRFLILAPLVCLTSATLSVGGLALIGFVDTGSFLANWFSWWAGDTLGLLLMLPIVLSLAGEPRALWRNRLRTVALPMLLVLVIFIAMYFKANQWEQHEALAEYQQITQQSLDQIRMGLMEESAMLTQMQGLFVHDAEGHVTRQEFHRYCQGTLKSFPMILAMEWVARVDNADRAHFVAAQDKESAGFQITEPDGHGGVRPAGSRAVYYPVTYIEPVRGNEAARGFDLTSAISRKEALERADTTNLAAATAPIKLVQGSAGMLILQTVRIAGRTTGDVMIVLNAKDFISKVLPAASGANLYIRLSDVGAGTILFDSFPANPAGAQIERTFDYGGRHYLLQTRPTPGYYRQHHGWQSWAVLAMGTFGTTLLGALLLLGSGYTARVEAKVVERTEALRESEERFRTTMENSPVGIAISGLGGELLQVNLAFCNVTGYAKTELARLTTHTLTHPEDRPLDAEYRRRILAGEQRTLRQEMRYVRKNGEIFWVQITASLEHDVHDTPEHFIVQIEDISERKQVADLLRESADEYKDLYDNAPCGYHSLDRNGKYVLINNTELGWIGHTRETVIGKQGITDFLMQESIVTWEYHFSRLLESGKAEGLELGVLCGDGSVKVVTVHTTAVYGSNGEFLVSHSVLTDVTAQKKMERMIQDKALELQTILDGSTVAITFVKGRKQIWSNSRMAELFGYTPEEMANQPTRLFYQSEQDYEEFGDHAYPVLQQGGVYQTEMEVRHHDGHAIWINISGKAIDSRNLALGSIWVLEDISERIRAQNALHESAREIEDLYNNAPCGYHSLDRNGLIVRVNNTELQWLGHDREEVLGRRFSEFLTPKGQERLKENFERFKHRGWETDLELELVRKDGSLLPVLLNGTAIYDIHGDFEMSRSTLFDMTERKRLEKRLEEEARTDALTGLSNRRYFYELAEREISLCKRLGTPLALLQMDIDHFKQVNDTYGHDIGDAVLKVLADSCRQKLREIDILARFGGEEFVVLLPGADKGHAMEAAERLRIALSKTTISVSPKGSVSFTVSIGVSSHLESTTSLDALLKQADNALYAAKHAGRNCVRYE